MTGDEFTARYRLRKQLTDGDIVSYLASDDRDGNVLVHVYHGESAPAFDASLLDEAGGEAVREILDVEGIAVIVTEPIEPFSTFEAWVAEHERSAEEDGPGAFTRIFRVQSPGEASDPAAEPEAGPSVEEEAGEESVSEGPPANEPAGSGPDGDEPGEFTRAFGALRQPPPIPEPFAPPPAVPDLPEGPVPRETETPAAPLEAADEPSFGAAPPPEPTQPQSAPSPPPPPQPAPSTPPQPPAEHGTGTFTRIMGAARGSPGSVDVPPPEGDAPSPTADSPPRPSPLGPGSAPAPPRPGGAPFPPERPDAPAAPRPGSAPPPPRRSTSPPPPRPGGAAPPRPSPGVPPPPRPGGAPPPPARPSPPAPPAQGSGGPPPPPAPPFPGSPPPASGVQKAEPGPYTRAMRAHRDSGQRPSPSPPAGPEDAGGSGYGGSESYLDRLRGRKSPDASLAPRPRTEEEPPPAPPELRTTVPPVPSGPSEYTRVIRGAEAASLGGSGSGRPAYVSPPTPAPPPAPAQPPAPEVAPATSRTPVVVMLVVTVVVVVAVVLFLALRTS